jgi:hypothetical protein
MPVTGFSDIGERLTTALVAGDFGLYQQVMDLPLTIVPLGEDPYILADEPALRRDFDLYHNVLKLHGVTDIFREVRGVFDEGAGVHRIMCRVNIMARANRIADPFMSEMLIRQRAGLWCILEIRSLAAHIGWTLGEDGEAQDFLKR